MKRILSFLLTLCLCFMVSACGAKSTDNDSGSTGGGSGSGGGSGDGIETVSALYDMRVASLTNEGVIENYHNTIIGLPNGEIMAIDLCINDMNDMVEFETQMTYFVNGNLPVGDGYSYQIDYLISTMPYLKITEMSFYDTVKVKNFYRPDMEIDLDLWYKAMNRGSGISNFVQGYIDYILALPDECLTGRERLYYDAEDVIDQPTDLQRRSKDYRFYYYAYNIYYLIGMGLMHDKGTNIIKTTSDSDFTKTFKHDGTTYSFSLDFYSPEPVVERIGLRQMYAFTPTTSDGELGKWDLIDGFYIDDLYQSQSYEFNTIVSLNYGEFDLLYLNSPTYNVLKSFINHHNPNKKYDVLLATYSDDSHATQYDNVWYKLFNEIELSDDIYVPGLLFDSEKIETNRFIVRRGFGDGTADFWNRNTQIFKKIFNYGNVDERVVTLENSVYVRFIESDSDMTLPVLRVNKNGEISLKNITSYVPGSDYADVNYHLLRPSIDGVLVPTTKLF